MTPRVIFQSTEYLNAAPGQEDWVFITVVDDAEGYHLVIGNSEKDLVDLPICPTENVWTAISTVQQVAGSKPGFALTDAGFARASTGPDQGHSAQPIPLHHPHPSRTAARQQQLAWRRERQPVLTAQDSGTG
jgi:hypothetical protein